LCQAARNAIHLGLGLLETHARTKPRQYPKPARPTIVEFLRVGHHNERHPDFSVVAQSLETGRRDPNDRVSAIVQLNLPSQNTEIAAEAPFPRPIAQHRHGVPLRHPILTGAEGSAQCRLDSEKRKIGLRNIFAGNPFRILEAPEYKWAVVKNRHRFKRAALVPPIPVIRIRSAPPLHTDAFQVAPQNREPLGAGIWQSPQNRRIHHAENRRVGTDPESQG